MEVLAIILGGGKGTRLYPLTKERAKPAVPFGGKYRLVDIPLSNCINSGLRNIYILTQFNSTSLHNHIAQTFLFDSFSRGFVRILAAEQTLERSDWYRGTADAVRQNFMHFHNNKPDYYLILAGDQLYNMEMKELVKYHIDKGADITIASLPVSKERASHLGILRCDKSERVQAFEEKPGAQKNIEHLRIPNSLRRNYSLERKPFLASMGIYLFSLEVLEEALENKMNDFAKEIIPSCLDRFRTFAYIYRGFWDDIGTIRSFYDANIDLASAMPSFNLYNETRPIYTRRRDLPPSKINASPFMNSISADGCIIRESKIRDSLIGIRSIIDSNVDMEGVFCMGSDYYETSEQKRQNRELRIPDIGIGRFCHIRRAIIDKNVRVGEGCRIGVKSEDLQDGEYGSYTISNGIVVIPKNAVIDPGSQI